MIDAEGRWRTETSGRARLLLPHGISSNIYVRELGRAYERQGVDVVYHADNLAEGSVPVDYIHLQWPEEQYRWTGSGTPEARATQFLKRLDHFLHAGARLIWTVHNLAPHEFFDAPLDRRIYQEVIDRAHVILHHCEHSKTRLAEMYRMADATAQIVVPHGHFLAYPHGVGKEEARRRLGLPPDAFVYLQFGQVRAYKGLDLMLKAFSRAKVPRKLLLVAGRFSPARDGNRLSERLRMRWIRHAVPNIRMHLNEIPNDDVQLYLEASDVMVLSHRAGLNSGAAVLGMTFGKLVIGPDLGCLSSVLAMGCNLVYPAGDVEHLAAAMERATQLDLGKASALNSAVAAGWDWDSMARRVLEAACPA